MIDDCGVVVDIVVAVGGFGEFEFAGEVPLATALEGLAELTPVGLKFDRGVEADRGRVVVFVGEAFDGGEEDFADAELLGFVAPGFGGGGGVGDLASAIDEE